jgi:hypothetical protein
MLEELKILGLGDFVTTECCGCCGEIAVGLGGGKEATEETEDARLRLLQVSTERGGLRLVKEERCLIGLGGRAREDIGPLGDTTNTEYYKICWPRSHSAELFSVGHPMTGEFDSTARFLSQLSFIASPLSPPLLLTLSSLFEPIVWTKFTGVTGAETVVPERVIDAVVITC